MKLNALQIQGFSLYVELKKSEKATFSPVSKRLIVLLIYEMPEFLYTLYNFSSATKDVTEMWNKGRKAYAIKYKASFKDYDCFMFYGNEMDCAEDKIYNYEYLKKKIILLAVQGMHGALPDDEFVYMKSEVSILPENILEIVQEEEWKINVLKYFGKA